MCHSKGCSKNTLVVGPNHEEIGHKLDRKDVLHNNCPLIFKNIKVVKVKERLYRTCTLMETRDTISGYKFIPGVNSLLGYY